MSQFLRTTKERSRLPCCIGCWLARFCICAVLYHALLRGMLWLTPSFGVTLKSSSVKTRRTRATKNGPRLLPSSGPRRHQPQMHHGTEQLEVVVKTGVLQLVQVEAIGKEKRFGGARWFYIRRGPR